MLKILIIYSLIVFVSSSIVKYPVAALVNGHSMTIKQSLTSEVPAQYFRRHHVSFISHYSLLPRVGAIGDHKSEFEEKRLHKLALQVHFLDKAHFLYGLNAAKNYHSSKLFASEHLAWEMNFPFNSFGNGFLLLAPFGSIQIHHARFIVPHAQAHYFDALSNFHRGFLVQFV